MNFHEYMSEWIDYCLIRRSCNDCDYYEKYKKNWGESATICFYNYILEQYYVININSLEVYTADTLHEYIRLKCVDVEPDICYESNCFHCKMKMIETDENIKIIKR